MFLFYVLFLVSFMFIYILYYLGFCINLYTLEFLLILFFFYL